MNQPAKTGKHPKGIVCIIFYGNVGTVWLLPDGRNFIALFD